MKESKSKYKKWTDLLISLSICLTIVIIVSLITKDTFLGVRPLQELELKFIDQRFQKRGEINIKDATQIVIVEINDETYQQIPYPWPWPRSVWTKMVENLTKAGAKVIAIDIEFDIEDKDPKNDALFRDAIKRSGRVILAGKTDYSTENKINKALNYDLTNSSGKDRTVIKKEKENYNNIFCDTDSLLSLVNIPEDIDNTYRLYTPYYLSRQSIAVKRIPTFGLAVVNKYLGLPVSTIAFGKEGFFEVGNIKIPAYKKTDFIVNLYGSGNTFPHYNFYEIVDDKGLKLKDEVDLEEDINSWEDPEYQKIYKDKIVLIGSTSVEYKDILSVAFSKGERSGDNTVFGVEYHANVIQNILSRDFLYTPDVYIEMFFFLLLSLIIFKASSLIKKIKIKHKYILELINIVLVFLAVLGVFQISIIMFSKFNCIISIVSNSAIVILTYFSNTAYHFIKERKQNVLIKGMFSHYVSHNVVDQLLADPDKLKLGGEKKTLTILFADIAGFTTISESKTPEDLVKFINTFLSEMTEVILSNQGTLDKYLGDAIMAFWGAPLPLQNHAALACKTACEMQERVAGLKSLTDGKFELKFRMGINTGNVVVGNIGGEKRFDYTVIGDSVNLASRLEGVNKEFGTSVIIGEETSQVAGEQFFIRELDEVRVKGKKKPTRVFELIGKKEDETAISKFAQLNYYFEGLKLYRTREFEKSLACFEKSLEINPTDTPSKVYIERLKYFIANAPDENWDGVFEMKTK